METLNVGVTKVCSNDPGHLTKDDCHVHILQNQKANDLATWCFILGILVCSNDDPSLTLT